MKRQISQAVLFGILVLGLSGCATRYQVKLDALGTGEGVPTYGGAVTYVLVSNSAEVKENDLFFKELVRHLTPALLDNGFLPAAEGETADIQIGVDAYISDPMVETQTYTDTVHIDYGFRPYYYRVPVRNKAGQVVGFHYAASYGHAGYGTGWVERDRQVTVFDKVLKLSAMRMLEDGSLSDELWMLKVSMRDQGTDFRASMPFLMVAAKPYIGRRTEGEIVITLKGDDPQITTYGAGLADGR